MGVPILNRPVTINGQELILVDDMIGDGAVPLDKVDEIVEIEPPEGLSPGFYIWEPDLLDIRGKFPDLPTYGLWQVLYHSGLLVGSELLSVPFNATGTNGRYARLSQESGKWAPIHSGIIFGKNLTEDPDSTFSQTNVLTFDLDELRLPARTALLFREQQALTEKRSRRRVLVTGLACVGIVLVTGIVEVVLTLQHRSQALEMASLKAEQKELTEQMRALTNSRLQAVSDYSTPIERLMQLYFLDPNITTARSTSFDDKILALVDRDYLPYVRTLPWTLPKISESGDVVVEVPTGNGDLHDL